MIANEKLNEAKKIMVEILQEIERICKEENIMYWLDGGTLLGAVRHKGFIPWDDDIDICMLEDDYDRFIKIANKKLNKEKYFLQTLENDKYKEDNHLKIRDRNSIFIEEKGKVLHHQGIFVDIFPMVIYSSKLKYLPKNFYNILIKLKSINLKRKQKNFFIKKILVVTQISKLADKILTLFLSTKNEEKKYVGYKYDWLAIYEDSDIFPLKKIEFEKIMFSSPKNEKNLLKELYGEDYMILPPEEKRVWHAKNIEIGKKCLFEKKFLT